MAGGNEPSSSASRYWDGYALHYCGPAGTTNRAEWHAHPRVEAFHNELRGGRTLREWFDANVAAGRRFERAIGIGCGAAPFELSLVTDGLVGHLDLVDLSPVFIEQARAGAAARGVADRVTATVGDGSLVESEGAYDLVLFISSLHHAVDVPGTLARVRQAMRPGAQLFANEYVGPSRFAFPSGDVAIVDTVYRLLDDRARTQTRLPLPDPLEVERADPTEAASSELLVPALRRAFRSVTVLPMWGGLLYPVWFGLDYDYVYTDAGSQLVGRLLDLDAALGRAGLLPSYFATLVASDVEVTDDVERRPRGQGLARAELPETAAPRDEGDDPHQLAVLTVPEGCRVLDLGCGTGRLAHLLAERGCSVVGIDRDGDALQEAALWSEHVIEADLESGLDGIDFGVGHGQFDVVCLLDFLEHIRNPIEVLEWSTKLLRPGGMVLVSLPNITHAAVRLQLLTGHFTYTPSGLLDQGHIRFYDRQAAESLLGAAGLEVIERLRVRRDVDETEIDTRQAKLSPQLLAELTRDDDALTYQFFFVASPLSGLAHPTLAAHLQGRLERAHAALADATTYARWLEQQISEKETALADASAYVVRVEDELSAQRRRGDDLESVLSERIIELGDRTVEVRALQADLAIKEAFITEVEQEARRQADTLGELDSRAAELDRLLTATTSRAGYRLIERTHRVLGTVPGLQRAGRQLARRLAGERRPPG
jgi:methionine biosynthesis protein MetW